MPRTNARILMDLKTNIAFFFEYKNIESEMGNE